jgi:hypothetical protein
VPASECPPFRPRNSGGNLAGRASAEQLPFRSAYTGKRRAVRVTDLHSTRCQERTKPRFAILEAPSSDETFRKKLGLGLQVERKT